jgi:Co/Zn/Cd efflux system component
MSGCHACEGAPASPAPGAPGDDGFRRALWIAFAVNAAMFLGEAGSSVASGSAALLADAGDFFADASTYAITLLVLGMGPLARARAALVKGLSMGLIGLWVIASIAHKLLTGAAPEPLIMGPVGVLALAANLSVAVLLYRHRGGDANRESVWLCSRNDAIGNVAVMAAAGVVYLTDSFWPDIAVAGVMAYLELSAAGRIVGRARGELRGAHVPAAAAAE